MKIGSQVHLRRTNFVLHEGRVIKIYLNMRKYILLLTFLSPFLTEAQTTAADTIAIKQACLDYVQGYFTSDTVRVAKAVHPDLAKRIVMKRFKDSLFNMTSAQLVAATRNSKNQGDPNPNEPFKGIVVIYDIDRDNATAKVSTNKMKFFDYVQLAKIKGEWKIINVLWAFTN